MATVETQEQIVNVEIIERSETFLQATTSCYATGSRHQRSEVE